MIRAVCLALLLLPRGSGSPSHLDVLHSVPPSGLAGTQRPGAVFDGDLDGWLAAINFLVPDGVIPPIKGTFKGLLLDLSVELDVHGLVCRGLRIGNLGQRGSKRVSPGSAEKGFFTVQGHTELEVKMEKVTLICTGALKYSSSMGIFGSAEATAQMQDATLRLKARLTSKDTVEPKVPDAVNLTDCKSILNLKLSIIAGTEWTQLLEAVPGLLPSLQQHVNSVLEEFLCGKGLGLLKSVLDNIALWTHDQVHMYMRAPAPPVMQWDEHLLRLEEVPLMRWLVQLQEDFRQHPEDLRNLLRRFPPSVDGFWPIIGKSAWAVKGRVCLLSDDRDTPCALHGSLHTDPPAVLLAEVESFNVSVKLQDAELLRPVNASLNAQGYAREVHVRAGLNLTFNGWVGGAEAQNLNTILEVDLVLEDVNASGALFLGIDRGTFEKLPSYSYVKLQCLAPSFRSLKVADLSGTFAIVSASVRVLRNTRMPSPLLVQALELVSSSLAVVATYDSTIVSALNGYLRNKTVKTATERLSRWASDLRELSCPEPLGEETDGGRHLPLIDHHLANKFLWTALSLAIAASLCGAFHLTHKRALSLWRGSSRDCRLSPAKPCLAGTVAWPVALTMVFCILACIFFLMGSNFLCMAQTLVCVEAKAGRLRQPLSSAIVLQVMVYSLFYSVRKLIEQGGGLRILAYALVIFSGVLPYMKLFAMLACWISPAKVISRKWRHRILLFVDQIGKFSLLDIFVIQFISGIMHATIGFTGTRLGGDVSASQLALVLRTNQAVGFTSFILASVGSLAIGHVCLYCHEENEKAEPQPDARATSQQALRLSIAQGPHTLREIERALSGRQDRHVTPVLLLTLLVMALGYALRAFTVTLRSPLGVLSEVSFSMFGFARRLPDFAEDPSNFSALFGQVAFVFFAMVSTQAHVVLLLLAWLVRLSPRRLAAAGVLAQVLSAWSALDVGILSMVLTLIEMSTSNFVPLSPQQQASLKGLPGISLSSEKGLEVNTSLGPGAFLLGCAALVHWWVRRLVMDRLQRAVRAQERGSRSAPLLTNPRGNASAEIALDHSVSCAVPTSPRSSVEARAYEHLEISPSGQA